MEPASPPGAPLNRWASHPRARSAPTISPVLKGPLGLNLLHRPLGPTALDLIFVHGLAGGAFSTWSKDGTRSSSLWIEDWLPRDPSFRSVQIWSFGYDGDWNNERPLQVEEKALLLLQAIQDSSSISHSSTTPFILVGHSVGGLLLKMTYILASQNSHYQSLAQRIRAMVFLATPHRILDATSLLRKLVFVAANAQPFINDLQRNSSALASINEEFVKYANSLELHSFYETVPSNYGSNRGFVVEEDLAVIGCESVHRLRANHLGMTKYSDNTDPNYKAVHDVLASIVESLSGDDLTQARQISQAPGSPKRISSEQRRILSDFLQVPDADEAEEDANILDARRQDGSCEWLLTKPTFVQWRDAGSQIYWLSAKPATGKSVLAGYIIDHLEDQGLDCSSHFFSHGCNIKSTSSFFLRSMAWQMGLKHPEILSIILDIGAKDPQLCKSDFKTIWRKLFLGGILKAKLTKKIYWVVDALDECKSEAELIPMLFKATESDFIRLFVTSRNKVELHKPMAQNFSDKVISEEISTEDTAKDILMYLQSNLEHIPSGNEDMISKIVEESGGNFLWVNIVVGELQHVHTAGEVHQVLKNAGSSLDDLYGRILDKMSQLAYGQQVAKGILTWIVCAARPLTVAELDAALKLDLKDKIENLQWSILSTCGQLVYVDRQSPGRIHMAHQTTREFLLNPKTQSYFAVPRQQGHKRLAMTCLKYLRSPEMKSKKRLLGGSITRKERSPFGSYACKSFYEHIDKIDATDDEFLHELAMFLKSNNVLSWIEYIAEYSELNRLVLAGKSFKDLLQRRSKQMNPFGSDVAMVNEWSGDLRRLVAKFGKNLKAMPSSIHHIIPPFCPSDSAPRKQFASTGRGISISGLSAVTWDDRLSTITFPGEEVTACSCSYNFLAIGLSKGRVVIYNEMTYQAIQTLQHKERVTNVHFGRKGQLLASSGPKILRVFDTLTWEEIWTINTPESCLAVGILEDEMMLLGALKNNVLNVWDLRDGTLSESTNWTEDLEGAQASGFRRPTAATLCLEAEQRQLAIVYRGQDILVWDLQEDALQKPLGRYGASGERFSPTIYAVAFSLDPVENRLAASYHDGQLILFDTNTSEIKAFTKANAHVLASSPDGRTLVTGDPSGTIQIFDFETLKLLYRISSEETSVRALAFTGDGRRLLDMRDSQITVWDPPALIRHDEDDQASDTVSTTSNHPLNSLTLQDADEVILITAIACPNKSDTIFVGRDNGTVAAYDANTGLTLKELFSLGYMLSVLSLQFNNELGILTSSDSSGRIVSRRLIFAEREWTAGEVLFDYTSDETVKQVFANKDHTRLLVCSSSTDILFHLNPKGIVIDKKILPSSDRTAHRWAIHPSQSDKLILIQDTASYIYTWDDLEESTYPQGVTLHGISPELFIRSITPCFNGQTLATTFADSPSVRAKSRLRLFQLSHLTNSSSTSATPLPAHDYLDKIEHLLGAYQSRLVFLHTDGWICSTASDTLEQSYTRHFFIPADWLCTPSELLIQVRGNGNIVFVKRSELAVIKRGLELREVIQSGHRLSPRRSATMGESSAMGGRS